MSNIGFWLNRDVYGNLLCQNHESCIRVDEKAKTRDPDRNVELGKKISKQYDMIDFNSYKHSCRVPRNTQTNVRASWMTELMPSKEWKANLFHWKSKLGIFYSTLKRFHTAAAHTHKKKCIWLTISEAWTRDSNLWWYKFVQRIRPDVCVSNLVHS